MALCPKCAGKLTKRKSDKTVRCKRHGFVRNINTPVEDYSAYAGSAQATVSTYTPRFRAKDILLNT